jgi:hypothetical protein
MTEVDVSSWGVWAVAPTTNFNCRTAVTVKNAQERVAPGALVVAVFSFDALREISRNFVCVGAYWYTFVCCRVALGLLSCKAVRNYARDVHLSAHLGLELWNVAVPSVAHDLKEL